MVWFVMYTFFSGWGTFILITHSDGDLTRVADLRFHAIPDVETRLQKMVAEAEAARAQQRNNVDGEVPMVSEEVSPTHIAEVVSDVQCGLTDYNHTRTTVGHCLR